MKSFCSAEDDGINRCVENNKKARWERFSDNQDNNNFESIGNVDNNNRIKMNN